MSAFTVYRLPLPCDWHSVLPLKSYAAFWPLSLMAGIAFPASRPASCHEPSFRMDSNGRQIQSIYKVRLIHLNLSNTICSSKSKNVFFFSFFCCFNGVWTCSS